MRRLALAAFVAGAALVASAPAAPQRANWLDNTVAVLQGLDKITARISTFEAPLDSPVRFGALEITARACRKRPPEETPETAAFLEIRDLRVADSPRSVFRGWMFSSSPALSALEHPVYDVWIVDCKNASR
ncbi:MAG: DUF2155 domain-containing protein [Alphaproteobacteria bacterium]